MTSTSAGRPPSSNGPNSIISTQGFNRKNSEQIGNGSENSAPRSTSDSWHTVGAVHPNKFQMKKSPRKKYIDVGTTVICIHTKVSLLQKVFFIQEISSSGVLRLLLTITFS